MQSRQKTSHPSSILTSFTSVFTRDAPNTEADSRTNDVLTDRDTSLIGHVTLTSDMTNKAHGPDGIPARLLTETANQVEPHWSNTTKLENGQCRSCF